MKRAAEAALGRTERQDYSSIRFAGVATLI